MSEDHVQNCMRRLVVQTWPWAVQQPAGQTKVGLAFARCKHGSELSCLPSRHCLDTLLIRWYGLIDFNPLLGNAKIFKSWCKWRSCKMTARAMICIYSTSSCRLVDITVVATFFDLYIESIRLLLMHLVGH